MFSQQILVFPAYSKKSTSGLQVLNTPFFRPRRDFRPNQALERDLFVFLTASFRYKLEPAWF